MSNTINWGKIYEKTAWGIGVVTNTISWGKIYADLVGALPSFALDFATISDDFTFTRSSFATRVNEFGLIETVTDLGSDLVQNGDFEELGSELVTNGAFDTDSDWSFSNASGTKGWRIADGRAICDETGSANGRNLRQFLGTTITSGKRYKVSLDILQSEDNIALIIGGENISLPTGTNLGYETTFTASSTSTLITFFASTSDTQEIDNVSVKQVDPNDNWDLGGWTIENGKAFSDGVNLGNINQSGLLSLNSRYKISVSVKDYNSGKLNVRLGTGAQIFVADGLGNFELELENTTSNDALRFYPDPSDPFDGSIDNISVQEVLEDDVPRIDYSDATFDVPVLGDELVTNGSFDTDSNWTKQSGWSIADGKATYDSDDYVSGNTNIYQQNCLVAGKEYVLTYDVVDYIEGDIRNVSRSNSIQRTSNGTYTEKFTATSVNLFMNAGNNGQTPTKLSIDNVSVKEVTAYTTTDKGSFLLEPQSTNLLPYSEDFSQWIVNGTLTSNAGISPDGTQNADLLDATPISGRLRQDLTLLPATDYTISLYIKASSTTGSTKFRVYEFDSTSYAISQVVTSQLIVGEWVRVTLSFTTNLGGLCQVRLLEDMPIGVSAYVYGAQVEALPYATSYIPTNGSAVTRSAESCVKDNLSTDGIFGGKEGTILLHVTDMAVVLTSLNNLTPFRVYRQSGDNYRFYYETDASFIGGLIDLSNNGGELKMAFSISETDINLYVNGSLHASYTMINPLPSDLESWVWNTETKYKERVKDFKIYNRALTDEELLQLTTI